MPCHIYNIFSYIICTHSLRTYVCILSKSKMANVYCIIGIWHFSLKNTVAYFLKLKTIPARPRDIWNKKRSALIFSNCNLPYNLFLIPKKIHDEKRFFIFKEEACSGGWLDCDFIYCRVHVRVIDIRTRSSKKTRGHFNLFSSSNTFPWIWLLTACYMDTIACHSPVITFLWYPTRYLNPAKWFHDMITISINEELALGKVTLSYCLTYFFCSFPHEITII